MRVGALGDAAGRSLGGEGGIIIVVVVVVVVLVVFVVLLFCCDVLGRDCARAKNNGTLSSPC